MKTMIVLFVLAVAGLLWMRHENTNLTRSLSGRIKSQVNKNADYHAEKPA